MTPEEIAALINENNQLKAELLHVQVRKEVDLHTQGKAWASSDRSHKKRIAELESLLEEISAAIEMRDNMRAYKHRIYLTLNRETNDQHT